MEPENVINNFFEYHQLINALTDLPMIKKKFRSCPPWSQENVLHDSMDHEKESNPSPENIFCDESFDETNMINDEEKVTLIFHSPKILIGFDEKNGLTNNNKSNIIFNENENPIILKDQNQNIIENNYRIIKEEIKLTSNTKKSLEIDNNIVKFDDSTQNNMQKEKLNNEIDFLSNSTQLNQEEIKSICFEIIKGENFLNTEPDLEEIRNKIFAALKKRNKENHSDTINQLNEKNLQDTNENELELNESIQLECLPEKELLPINENIFCKNIIPDEKISSNEQSKDLESFENELELNESIQLECPPEKELLLINENIFCKNIIPDEKISSNEQSIDLESIVKTDDQAKIGFNESNIPLHNNAEIKGNNHQLSLKKEEYFNCFEMNQNEINNKENNEENFDINYPNGEQKICEDQSAKKENKKHASIMKEINYNLTVKPENFINENKKLNSVLIMNNERDKLIRDEITSELESCSGDERENNSQTQKEILYWKNLISKTLSNIEEKQSYEKITISSEVQTEWSGSCKCSLAVINLNDEKLNDLEIEKCLNINEKKRQCEYILERNIKRKCLFQSDKTIQEKDDENNNQLEEPNQNGWFHWGTKVNRARRVGLSKNARPNRLHSFHNN